LEVLEKSNLISNIVRLASEGQFNFESDRKIRHGYMGFVIKLANMVKSVHDTDDLNSVDGAKEIFEDDWVRFVAGELTSSNEVNSRSLGNKPKMFMEEEDSNFEVDMEKVMSRFNSFNSIVSQSSNDEDEDDKDLEEEPEDDEPLKQIGTPIEVPKVEVELPAQVKVDSEFADAKYWEVNACE